MVLYLDSMCHCGLHAVHMSHIGILTRRLAAEPRSTAGLLCSTQCPSGTILLTPYSMVRDWRASRAEPRFFYWPKLLYPYYSLLIFSPFWSFCLYWLLLWGCGLRTNRVYITLSALHCRPLLIIIIIIIISFACITGRQGKINNIVRNIYYNTIIYARSYKYKVYVMKNYTYTSQKNGKLYYLSRFGYNLYGISSVRTSLLIFLSVDITSQKHKLVKSTYLLTILYIQNINIARRDPTGFDIIVIFREWDKWAKKKLSNDSIFIAQTVWYLWNGWNYLLQL